MWVGHFHGCTFSTELLWTDLFYDCREGSRRHKATALTVTQLTLYHWCYTTSYQIGPVPTSGSQILHPSLPVSYQHQLWSVTTPAECAVSCSPHAPGLPTGNRRCNTSKVFGNSTSLDVHQFNYEITSGFAQNTLSYLAFIKHWKMLM